MTTKCTGRPANLHARAAECGDQESRDDCSEQPLLGLGAARDTERHRQRQRNDAHRRTGRQILDETSAVVTAQ